MIIFNVVKDVASFVCRLHEFSLESESSHPYLVMVRNLGVVVVVEKDARSSGVGEGQPWRGLAFFPRRRWQTLDFSAQQHQAPQPVQCVSKLMVYQGAIPWRSLRISTGSAVGPLRLLVNSLVPGSFRVWHHFERWRRVMSMPGTCVWW